jgi:ribosomal protein L19E
MLDCASAKELEMAETKDAVMPLLKKIQKDIADSRKSIEAKVNDVAATVLGHSEKLDEIEGLMTYHLGITSQHVHDIKSLRKELKDIKARIAALESRS